MVKTLYEWDRWACERWFISPLVNARVHPNAVTLFTLIAAVSGALVMPQYLWLGVLLFFIGRFFDNADGGVARASNKVTKFGESFDTWTGAASLGALFFMMGSGALAFLGVAGAVLSRVLCLFVDDEKEFFNPTWLRKFPLVVELLRNELAGMPYFLLPLFAAFDCVDVFLWLTLLGNWLTIIVFTPILLKTGGKARK